MERNREDMDEQRRALIKEKIGVILSDIESTAKFNLISTNYFPTQACGMLLVYVAAPYTGKDLQETYLNITKAHMTCLEVANEGSSPDNMFFAFPISPCSNTAYLESTEIDPSYVYTGATLLLSKCNVAYFAKGWQDSKGCWEEYQFCIRHGIPTLFKMEELRAYLRGEITDGVGPYQTGKILSDSGLTPKAE